MKGLLWKDYRLNRGLLLLAVVVLAGVHVVGFAVEVSHTWPAWPTAQTWADGLASYGHLAMCLTPYIAAVLGGNAIACERADRSAHFLAYLPPTKVQVVTSKLTVGVVAVALFAGANLLLARAVAPLVSPDPFNFLYMLGTPALALCACIMTFGVGWLGSACFEKPTFPVLIALTSPFVLAFALTALALILDVSRFELAEWAGVIGLALGLVAFSAGTCLYLRRVEP
jgi:ABC-type transport system involved in multi-copper enzyme maturation permease subunit